MKSFKVIVLCFLILLILASPLMLKSFVEDELKQYALQSYKINELSSPVEFNWITMNFESQIYINEIEYGLDYSVFDFQIMDVYLYFATIDKFENSFLGWASHLPSTASVEGSIIVNIDAFDYSNTSNMLYLSVKNTSKSRQNSSIDEMTATAYDCISFLRNEYRISGIQVIYFDLSGGYTTVIPYSPRREEISLAMLTQKARKLKLNELGEVGLKWIEDNNK